MNTIRLLVAVVLLGLAANCGNLTRSRNTANPNVSGETLALQVCSNCHGPTGNSTSPNFPNLAAQQEAYTVSELLEFKGHNRTDPAGYEHMWGLSQNLTEKQIQELAAYFASARWERQPIEGKPERMDAGKAIFTDGVVTKGTPPCASCHGPDGLGNGMIPRIAGQHVDYLIKQLKVFQLTDQRPDGVPMKVILHGLTTEDIENVSAYVQAMPNQ